MNVWLKLRASEWRWFWVLRGWVQSVRFRIRRKHLSLIENVEERKTNVRVFLVFIRMSALPALFAAAVAGLLLTSELYFFSNGRLAFLSFLSSPDRDSYTSFLDTIAAIGGVLIGLYYAGVTAVSSAAYANVPNSIRNLLVRERLGSLYIRFLAFVTFLSLSLAFLREIGFTPIRLALPLIIVLAALSIFSFVHLGQHTFYFFDPTALGNSLFYDLHKSMRRATVRAPHWNDPSFQSHANRQARSTLNSLKTLVDVSLEAEHLKGGPTAELGMSTSQLLCHYISIRKQIPTASLWYPQVYRHRDWYESPESASQLAEVSGSSLYAEQHSEVDWFEDECWEIIARTLSASTMDKSESAFRVLSSIQIYIEVSGSSSR